MFFFFLKKSVCRRVLFYFGCWDVHSSDVVVLPIRVLNVPMIKFYEGC